MLRTKCDEWLPAWQWAAWQGIMQVWQLITWGVTACHASRCHASTTVRHAIARLWWGVMHHTVSQAYWCVTCASHKLDAPSLLLVALKQWVIVVGGAVPSSRVTHRWGHGHVTAAGRRVLCLGSSPFTVSLTPWQVMVLVQGSLLLDMQSSLTWLLMLHWERLLDQDPSPMPWRCVTVTIMLCSLLIERLVLGTVSLWRLSVKRWRLSLRPPTPALLPRSFRPGMSKARRGPFSTNHGLGCTRQSSGQAHF